MSDEPTTPDAPSGAASAESAGEPIRRPSGRHKQATLDFKSGGWVLVLMLVLCSLVVAWRLPYLIDAAARSGVGDGQDPTTYGFELGGLAAEQRATLAAAAPKDMLPSLVDPALMTAAEAGEFKLGRSKLLVRGDRVIGVVVDGEACAYPLRVMNWHEVVEHELGGVPLAVTYSALCDAVRVYDRRLGGETVSLGVSGLLIDSNPLLYDKRGEADSSAGESLWSQLDGAALSGPLAGQRLRALPATLTHWEDWLALHPETRVITPDLRRGKLYKRDPYSSYEGTEAIRFPVDPEPPAGLSPKARVLAVTAGGETCVFPLDALATAADDAGEVQATVGGHALRFALSRDPAGVQAKAAEVSAPAGVALEVVPCFWFAWYAAHPDRATLWEAPQ